MRKRSHAYPAVSTLALLLATVAVAGEDAEKKAEPAPERRWGVGWDDGIAFQYRPGGGWGVGVRLNPDLLDSETDSSPEWRSRGEWDCGRPGSCVTEDRATVDSSRTEDVRTFSTSVLVFHERPLGRWLAAGPYLAGHYTRRTSDEEVREQLVSVWRYASPGPRPYSYESRTEQRIEVDARRWERTLGVELGVRPVFRFHERFLLETRFGLELQFTRWTRNGTENRRWNTERADGTDPAGPVAAPAPGLTDGIERAIWFYPGSGEATAAIDESGSDRRFHAVGQRIGPDAEVRFTILF